jgi:hypothetical protein
MAGQIHDYPVLIDIKNRTPLLDFFATVATTLPDVHQGDTLRLILMAVEEHPQKAGNPQLPWRYVQLSTDLIAAIGEAGAAPELGTFTITFGANTTSALAYNATAAEVQTALNLLASVVSAGGVTVTGANGGPYRVVFDDVGDRSPMTGNADALYPSTSVEVYTVRGGTASLSEIQTIALERQPAAVCDFFSNLPSAAVSIETLQDGTADKPEVQRVTLDPNPYGGTFALTFGAKSTGAIDYDATAEELQEALEALSNIGADNVTVTGASPQWVVTFNGLSGNQSAMTGDATGLLAPLGVVGEMNLATEGILNLLNNEDEVDLTFEIEDSSKPVTLLHDPITVINDLIPTDPGAPREIPGYLSEDQVAQGYIPSLPCSALTGGAAGALDAIVTDDYLDDGTIRLCVVSGTFSVWQLQAGTTAENAAAGIVRPDDYAASTNERIWTQVL